MNPNTNVTLLDACKVINTETDTDTDVASHILQLVEVTTVQSAGLLIIPMSFKATQYEKSKF